MLVVLTVAAGAYVQSIASLSSALGYVAPPSAPIAIRFVIAVVAFSILGHIVIAFLSPEDADDAMDERDRPVAARAGNLSGYVLAGGTSWAMAVFLFNGDGNALFHGVFISLVLCQIAEYALQVYFYRRAF